MAEVILSVRDGLQTDGMTLCVVSAWVGMLMQVALIHINAPRAALVVWIMSALFAVLSEVTIRVAN